MTYGQTPPDPFAAESLGQPTPPPYVPPAYQDTRGYAQPSPAPAYGQPSYPAPQYGAPAFPTFGPRGDEKNWMGIVSLVASIAAFFVAPFVGSVAAVVFGHLGLGAVRRGEARNRGLALWGTILGYVGIGITVIVVIAYIALFAFAVQEGGFSGSIDA
ncbi:DUF4190 domain-containing protein [Demequina lignilytica]|uniref:DUF4190 domain-containing protein n=1 Tax=Demequina lignilytica TaxID=3051663 RepID=A0AB35MGJ6_9MICO|nr:DUF4190 domain-containing protein [Demequina sp. SYSU T0a273]MDN4482900.1 DUF4190 domain-containing protein [Demequina sp. SYSU T0a273]